MTTCIDSGTDRASTTIKIFITTRDRITAVGRKGETYDRIINRLLDFDDALTVGVSRAISSPAALPAVPAPGPAIDIGSHYSCDISAISRALE